MSTENKIEALRKFLNLGPDAEIEETKYGTFDANGCEYRVLTDDEADQAFREAVEQYIEDCVFSEIPSSYHQYFDLDRFARDVELSDGRGNMLASYDSEENEERVGSEWYYIYRTN